MWFRFQQNTMRTWLLWLCLWIVLITLCQKVSLLNVTVGFLVPMVGKRSYGEQLNVVAQMAINDINNDSSLKYLRSNDIVLDLVIKDTQCDNGHGVYSLVHTVSQSILNQRDVGGFIGPACDAVCESSAFIARNWGVPIISYACGLQKLSDGAEYSTFARTSGVYDGFVYVVEDIMNRYGWSRIVLVEGHDDIWTQTGESFGDYLEQRGFSVDLWVMEDNQNLLKEHISQEAEKSRVFLLCAYGQDIIHMLCSAQEEGMLNGEYAFITIDFSRAINFQAAGCDVVKVTEGIIDITMDTIGSNNSQALQMLRELNITSTFHAAAAYDAFRLYAHALNGVYEGGHDYKHLKESFHLLSNVVFQGLAGPVYINGNRTRESMILVHSIHMFEYVTFGYSQGWIGDTRFDDDVIIRWPGGGTTPPSGHPPCDWDGSLCPHITDILVPATVASVSLGVLLIASGIIGVYFWKRRKENMEKMKSMTWKVSPTDLKFVNNASRLLHSRTNVQSSKESEQQEQNHVETFKTVTFDLSRKGSYDSQASGTQMFAKTALYNSTVVAVKFINKSYIALTDEVIMEINEVRELKHPNINSLLGASVEPMNVFLISEYCNKGSLEDVLQNDNIKLDWIFKLSFMSDIAKGMQYIHDSDVATHGHLKSSNVYVDSRWMCRVGDIYMPKFREGEKEQDGKEINYYKLLWTAPELLREEGSVHPRGTQKGDVYAFAIIVQEIVMRSGPYSDSSLQPCEIVQRVSKRLHPPFRPKVPPDAAEEPVLDLMRMCWEDIPMFRPSFATVMSTIKRFNKGKNTNLVDQMIHMMEKYADRLEEIVEERTEQLEEEKKKVEDLLGRMLPRSVTEDLKVGKTIAPETFEQVTVFFSDIVGFTALSSESEPTQIVNFLNDLYTCFDTIIESYDVYKVETIGDAYMVVSGLPERNGDRHSGEIANMALDLLSSVMSFKIRHRPDLQLMLRIGLHTGPVAAGVVGLKMPRYCLFGDTVNYASRMESTGLPLRIHVSPQCKRCLDIIGGYHTVPRGPISVKGKGIIETFFLQGRDGFDKPLPDFQQTTEKTTSVISVAVTPGPSVPASPQNGLLYNVEISNSDKVESFDKTPD